MDLRTTGMEFASEFVIKAVKTGLKMAEIPITLWPDKRGRPPHLRSFRDGWRHLRFMLLYAPNWLFLGPGLALAALGFALVFWLLPGPRFIGQVRFDIHTMFFGMIFALLGAQIAATGMFAKVFCFSEQFDRQTHQLENWLKRLTFEHGLIGGSLLGLIGFAGNVWILAEWAQSDFGLIADPARTTRLIIFCSLWMFLGVQIVFSSFFLSMLGVSRGTFIGDKDFQK